MFRKHASTAPSIKKSSLEMSDESKLTDLTTLYTQMLTTLNSLSLEGQRKGIKLLHDKIDTMEIASSQKAALPDSNLGVLMTWNLKMLINDPVKIKLIGKVVTENAVDIFIVQEIKTLRTEKMYIQTIKSILVALGEEEWDHERLVAGKGYHGLEVSAIFYRRNKFDLTHWFSGFRKMENFTRTPILFEMETKAEPKVKFTLSNFHIRDGSLDKKAHFDEIDLLSSYFDELISRYEDEGIHLHLVAGDFNCECAVLSDKLSADAQNKLWEMEPKSCTINKKKYDYMLGFCYEGKICSTEIVISDYETSLASGVQVSDHKPVAFSISYEPQPEIPQKPAKKGKK